MAKWEYQTILSPESDLFNFLETTRLNQYGKEGWEMCGMSSYFNDVGKAIYVIIFKRKIED